MNLCGKGFKLIDISRMIVPGANPERPFDMTPGVLGDGTTKFDVTRTHTHVGTHVEAARHFFEDGRSIDRYPLEAFTGRGVLLELSQFPWDRPVGRKEVISAIGDILQDQDIVVCRNSDPAEPARIRHFSEEAGFYFKERRVKMIVLGDHVGFGESVDQGRRMHEILMRETTFLEIVKDLDQISKRTFVVMALPILIQGADSAWCRAVVMEERDCRSEIPDSR